jgi:nitrogenase molybdenum-iron protein alpha/beta subunit
VAADLPVGLEGTSRFLRTVGEGMGLPAARVEEAIAKDRARAEARIELAARRLRKSSAAVFLDTAMAAAVYAYLRELGVRVPLVCLTDGDDASAEDFLAAATRLGADAGAWPEIVAGASRDDQLAALYRLRDREWISLVIGSAIQQAALEREHLPIVELGYPSSSKHWLYPMPWMGFNGAVALAQRFLDCASEALAF